MNIPTFLHHHGAILAERLNDMREAYPVLQSRVSKPSMQLMQLQLLPVASVVWFK